MAFVPSPWASAGGNGVRDNDGEYWGVYAPDGTEYIFGLGYEPNKPGSYTNAQWTVPVRGQAGEPCANMICPQAYKWNLDRVIDANGNVATIFYEPEINTYADPGGSGYMAYANGGHVLSIEYGKRAYSESVAAPSKVLFSYSLRDNNDFPLDSMCVNGYPLSGCRNTPSFFIRRLLTQTTTQVLVSGVYSEVERFVLVQEYLNGLSLPYPGTANSPSRYWLRSVQRQAGGNVLPITRFDNPATVLRNLLDLWGDEAYFHRVSQIQDGKGSDIRVWYGRPHQCMSSALGDPANYPEPNGIDGQRFSENWYNCFPQWTVNYFNQVGFRRFNKYLVTAVDVRDNTGGSPTTRTQYDYFQSAGGQHVGWRYNDDPMTPVGLRTYSVWQGYPMVHTRTGAITYNSFNWGDIVLNSFAPTTLTETRYFTGMNGDPNGSGGTKSWTVLDSDNANPVGDDRALAGWVRQTRSLTTAGAELASSLSTYWTYATTTGAPTGRNALLVRESQRFDRRAKTGGYDTKTTLTTYDNAYGRQIESVEQLAGVTYRSTWTTYEPEIFNIGPYYTWVANRPKVLQLTSNGPNAVELPITNTAVIARTEIGYDSNKNPTSVKRFRSNSTADFVSTSAVYDPSGRMTSSTDAMSNTTTASYSPPAGFVTTVTLTPPVAVLQTSYTVDPKFGVITSMTDAAGSVTSATYDGFGRRTTVIKPGSPPVSG